MWHRVCSAAGLLLGGALAPAPSLAQSPSKVSIEATIGLSTGAGGGLRRHRDGVSFDGVVAWRARRLGRFLAVVGGGVAIEGPYGGDDSCLIAPNGGCVRDYPTFTSIGVFGGLEREGRFGSVRLVAGPSQLQGRGEGRAFGIQARAALATPAFFHAALVGSARVGMVPRLNGERYRLAAFGVGLRLQ